MGMEPQGITGCEGWGWKGHSWARVAVNRVQENDPIWRREGWLKGLLPPPPVVGAAAEAGGKRKGREIAADGKGGALMRAFYPPDKPGAQLGRSLNGLGVWMCLSQKGRGVADS